MSNSDAVISYSSHGIGIGSALAVAMSWGFNHSVMWALGHGLLGWIYVIYAVFAKEY